MSPMSADQAGRALLRALRPHAGSFTLLGLHSREWASSLFEGARHRIALVLDGADAPARAALIETLLPEAELDFPGGFVADILVVARLDGTLPVLAIEALTITDPERGASALTPVARRVG